MRVIRANPPLFDRIDAAFGIAGKPVIFSWGDRIYNPMGISVTSELHAHEAVHGRRQGGADETAIVAWWERYIDEPAFRLAEEVPAHRAEYMRFCARHGNKSNRANALDAIASRLASPLYGDLVSQAQARLAVLRGFV